MSREKEKGFKEKAKAWVRTRARAREKSKHHRKDDSKILATSAVNGVTTHANVLEKT